MGQAKRRGTFEERAAMALARNQVLQEKAKANAEVGKAVRRYGPQRFATKLVMAGLMGSMAAPGSEAAKQAQP